MISFIEGKIEYLGDKFVVLNAGGIGYRVNITPKLANILATKQEVVNPVRGLARDKVASPKDLGGATSNGTRLFIHSQLNMREGTFDMYGFPDREGLELFNLLIGVSGIGPKNALGILSSIEPKHLKAAIVNDDPSYLNKISGLGPKTAQRLVLELKNKVDYIDMGDMKGLDLGQEGHAMDALVSLGYSPSQAKDALKDAKGKTLEERVREALKSLGKK